MSPVETQQQPADDSSGHPPVPCSACQSALRSPERDAVSFLLLDQFTIPLVGCEEHLEQFRSVCALTTEDEAELLDHHPAGGINCPGCRLAPHNPEQPVMPISDGAVAILACPQHQSDIITRFHSGLQTRQQLTKSLETANW
ncbi:hypothetical protein [Salinibaculum rarum]|uniref:hypothetical protein n=1 Tax=Salinibaculum rarum TaxID=3058903 RepID=UPI00265D7F0B|nr:hypothetical protein [Salinibaculum sp. KK48]